VCGCRFGHSVASASRHERAAVSGSPFCCNAVPARREQSTCCVTVLRSEPEIETTKKKRHAQPQTGEYIALLVLTLISLLGVEPPKQHRLSPNTKAEKRRRRSLNYHLKFLFDILPYRLLPKSKPNFLARASCVRLQRRHALFNLMLMASSHSSC